MTITINYTADPAAPAVGQRLQLGNVCVDLRVSVADLAAVVCLPKTTAFKLLTNEWPHRLNESERARMREQIEQHLLTRGATPEQLATLWHAHLGKGARAVAAHAAAKTLRTDGQRTVTAMTNPDPEEDKDMLLPKQTLTPLARRHFKLTTNPFQGEVTSEVQMFNGDDIHYVRESAWQCCKTGSFVAIVGESGAGKTTVQTDLEERIAQSNEPITVIKPSVLGMEQSERQGTQLRSADILHAIISTLAPQRTMPQTLQARTVAAHKLLTASAELGNMHLLVVEEAHSMPDAALKHLKRLHELRNGRRPLLGILLIAQPELKKRLANGLRDGSLREVAQRCEIVELLPLDGDLRAYLACRAGAAGVKLDDLIDPQAVEAMRERLMVKGESGSKVSICYPLAVNNLLTRALNKAAEIGMPVVNRDLVAKV
jgi:type II secretory pathway predicted ATPase ExeA